MLVKSVARLKYVSIPPRKMRLVADMVKGMPVEKALDILNFTPKVAARHLAKTLKSAAANALSSEGTDHLRPEDLMIENIIVNAAPTQKRIRFQSMGRAFRYRKRYCHLTVNVWGEMKAVDVKATSSRAKKAEKESADEAGATEKKKAAPKKKKTAKRTDTKRSSGKKVSTKGKATLKKTSAAKKTG